jgi:ATP-dependent DNA ligase
VEVEDHPLDYGDFEGTIPKGQYGGGTVMVWDRGFWNCDDPEKAYRKGKLDFTLEGEKLHGGWILTRMRNREGEKRKNWLLIKHRDAFAREGKKNTVLDKDASAASGRSMDDIAAGKGRVRNRSSRERDRAHPQRPNGSPIVPRAVRLESMHQRTGVPHSWPPVPTGKAFFGCPSSPAGWPSTRLRLSPRRSASTS